MKKLKLFLATSFILGMIIVNVFWVTSKNNSSLLLEQFLSFKQEALADVSGENTEVKRLIKEDCKCSNGKDGFTLKCDTKGDLEKCTPTQQGSNACYRISLGLDLVLCKDN